MYRWFLSFCLAICVSPSWAAELEGTYRFGPIAAEDYVYVASLEPVVVTLEPGDKHSLLERSVQSSTGAFLVSGVSADFIYMAVISGEITAETGLVGPGHVIFWRPGSTGQIAVFDAAKLLATLHSSIKTEYVESLQQVADEQAQALWWGLLRPAGLNLQASTPAGVEIERRSYLSEPAVLALRFGAQSVEQLSADVASAFVVALEMRNTDAVAALLHPRFFIEDSDYGVSPAALARRLDFATALVATHAARLVDHLDAPRQADDGSWSVGEEVRFSLAPGDGFLFVEPASLR